MIIIPFIANLYQYAKENNLLAGMIITDLIAFIAFLIFPAGIFFSGDLQMIIGSLLGVYFSLSHKKQGQSEIVTGLTVGITGTIFTAISLSFFEWMIYAQNSPISLFFVIIIFFIEAIVIGLAVGILLGFLFARKKRGIIVDKETDEKFFESLKER
ncbi:MAG: hypothetical protein ACFFB0_02245 [Promethearchaeota archaeon]